MPVNFMLADGSNAGRTALKLTSLAVEILELNSHTSTSKYDPCSEAYLEPSQTSTMELFCGNS